ncbi:TPA: discoidin domain-containing protein [Bacillus albus]
MITRNDRKLLSAFLLFCLVISLFSGINVQKVQAAETNLEDGLIPQSGIKATASSSSSEEGSEKTLDGDSNTKWHTSWDGTYTSLPHSITYNLGKSYDGVYKLKYLPRQDEDWNGVVTKFEISVSTDGSTFTKVAEGTWAADKNEKTATFNAREATYVKFTALASRSDSGKQFGSAAEINIYNKSGYEMNKSPLMKAIADVEAFISDFTGDPSYLTELKALKKEAETLLGSTTATEEEIAKMTDKLIAKLETVQSGEAKVNGVKVFYAPEAYTSNPASYIIDGKSSTFYETNWTQGGRFYKPGDYIILDLNESKIDVGKILYTPRQDIMNGRIEQYNIYLSNDDLSSTTVDGTQSYLDDNFTLVGKGKWDTTIKDKQTATFKSDSARYVAIQALSTGEDGNGNTLSVGDFEVYQKQVDSVDTKSVEALVDKFNKLKSSDLHPNAVNYIDKQLTGVGDGNKLTVESVEYYATFLEHLYALYKDLGKYDSFRSGEVWLDTDGVPLQAHGGGILYNEENKTYYWYGEDKTENNFNGAVPVTGIRAYSSKDLYNWKNEGVVLPVFNNPQLGEENLPAGNLPLYLDENSETYKNSGKDFDPNRVVNVESKDIDYTGSMKSPSPTLSKHNSPERIAELNALYADKTNAEKQAMYKDFNWDKVVERPKVIYNKKTHKYVMWWHHDGPIAGNYLTAEGGVAISDSPTGPFKYLGTSRLSNTGSDNGNEGMLRDMTLFVDDDGDETTHDKAYLIYSSEENSATIIMQLNEDYTAPATNENGQSVQGIHWVRAHKNWREAPTLFKQDGTYYMITSGLTGWNPNRAKYHVSTNGIFGPWEDKGDPMVNDTEGTTFRSQSTFVLPYRDDKGDIVPNKFIFMADRWNPKNLKDSRNIWLPFELNNRTNTVQINWHAEWDTSIFKKDTESPAGDFKS